MNRVKKFLSSMISLGYYPLTLFISSYCGYRFYWKYEDYYSIEHIIVLLLIFHIDFLCWWCHFKAMTSDAGKVKRHHFRERGKIYLSEGPKTWG